MIQAIKEIFIVFIALYLLVIVSGIFNSINLILAEKAITEAPQCIVRNNDKPCTCSCSKEFARECCCCSVEETSHQAGSDLPQIVFKGSCNELPTIHSNFIALKFVVTTKTGYYLYPKNKKYDCFSNKYSQDFSSSIDHPPPHKLS
ncbi:MAG: hypothetical protein D8M58_11715 [Calditrichaeota bacterium]|nr:MAG: hypothetical protein DWQ03_12500 [Calditrichota bacterium]MBL1206062.1 hypothetical protein [Calditrichota bacterium]NOG45889.1 hypothetical protein [Calditrichota bacterium]